MSGNHKKNWSQISMLTGAIYDCVFGSGILFAPTTLAHLINLNMPVEQVYLRLCGLFLLIIGGFYFLYWIDRNKYRLVIVIAIFARFAGLIYFAAASLFFGYPVTFLVLGLLDGCFALVHTILFISEKEN